MGRCQVLLENLCLLPTPTVRLNLRLWLYESPMIYLLSFSLHRDLIKVVFLSSVFSCNLKMKVMSLCRDHEKTINKYNNNPWALRTSIPAGATSDEDNNTSHSPEFY